MADYPVLDGNGNTIIAAATGPATSYPVLDGNGNTVLAAATGPETTYPVLSGSGVTLLSQESDPNAKLYDVLDGLGNILIKGGGAYEAEATALFARFTTPPTSARKAIINTLIKALKDGGVWSKLDALYLTAAADAQAARRNWVQDAFNLTAVNSPTFTADRGYAGNGSSSYLRTGFNPTTAPSPKFAQNSAHVSLADRTSRAAASRVEMGAINAGPTIFMAQIATRFTGGTALARITGSVTGIPAFASTESSGRFVVSRTGATAMEAYRNAASIGTSANASASLLNLEIYLGALNSNGSPLLYSTDQIAQAGVGSALSGAEVATLDAAIAAYLTAVGA